MSTIVLDQKPSRKTIVLNFKNKSNVAISGLTVSVQEPNVVLPRTGTTDGSGDVSLDVYPGDNALSVNGDVLKAPYTATLTVYSDGTYRVS